MTAEECRALNEKCAAEYKQRQQKFLRFDPQQTYANAISITAKGESLIRETEWAIKSLTRNAAAILPPGTPYSIRQRLPEDFGRRFTVYWEYHPPGTPGPSGDILITSKTVPGVYDQ